MRKYLVENVSKEMQMFHGHALGGVRGSRKGGSLWLYEEQFNTLQVQARLESGVMALIKVVPPIPEEAPTSIPHTVSEEAVEEVQSEEAAEIVVEEIAEEPVAVLEESEAEVIDYSSLKSQELRALLKERGLYDPSKKKKADMIKILEESDED